MAQVKPAWVAIKKVAEVDSDESRIGQAMHRLLEWVAPAAPPRPAHTWSDAQRAAVAELFALDAAQVAQAQAGRSRHTRRAGRVGLGRIGLGLARQ